MQFDWLGGGLGGGLGGELVLLRSRVRGRVRGRVSRRVSLTEIQGCFRASAAVMRFPGLIVSILLMRSLASGVTVSHSGEGN